jgi:hypothetical protein
MIDFLHNLAWFRVKTPFFAYFLAKIFLKSQHKFANAA